MDAVRTVLERYAAGTPHEELARAFLEHRRWTGDDPYLLLTEAAASTTGQRFTGGIKPAVERFQETFLETNRVTSFDELAALDPESDDLVDALGAERKRHVLLEAADVLADRPEDDDLAALSGWAAEADHYRHDENPIGSIAGVGPSTFQYLRQLAGVDAARPDQDVVEFLTAVDAELESSPLDTSDPCYTIASCEWLALVSSFRPLEIDRIAWWTVTDEDERETVLTDQLEGFTVDS
ncbi:hypothetical protein [Natronobacterium gregoryi]|uniref:Uncharacterized protein n=2 Tax=Natronobacterium gregoryi TaxID=44930 RepID=L0ADB4_NATGS|nr:hypothetical protein [Natronobacterium gregoryi]AFZ71903.1 hypothetical protein Natgr_0655 [Natronobacterium gregoryi SP2]ELY62476.1 hypothetical protein C490_17978 [Natronobacterium gregoryi SP2]PLK20687.1 hypothetical protein CYV19_07980 [Natronobacterium gregoryi SP2]SFJ14378.1 hypothetical protein SAMN05443661_11566 [Natronobacterium gregoryi]